MPFTTVQELKEQDYYKRLEVERHASEKNVKTAYRALALQYHPDRSSEADPEIFKCIQEAFETLSDKPLRRAYDTTLPPLKIYKKPYSGTICSYTPQPTSNSILSYIQTWAKGGIKVGSYVSGGVIKELNKASDSEKLFFFQSSPQFCDTLICVLSNPESESLEQLNDLLSLFKKNPNEGDDVSYELCARIDRPLFPSLPTVIRNLATSLSKNEQTLKKIQSLLEVIEAYPAARKKLISAWQFHSSIYKTIEHEDETGLALLKILLEFIENFPDIIARYNIIYLDLALTDYSLRALKICCAFIERYPQEACDLRRDNILKILNTLASSRDNNINTLEHLAYYLSFLTNVPNDDLTREDILEEVLSKKQDRRILAANVDNDTFILIASALGTYMTDIEQLKNIFAQLSAEQDRLLSNIIIRHQSLGSECSQNINSARSEDIFVNPGNARSASFSAGKDIQTKKLQKLSESNDVIERLSLLSHPAF